jgi:hypothetical protein
MGIGSKAWTFACALGLSFGLIGIPAATAITWDFSSPTGDLGPTHSYTVSGLTITAAGFHLDFPPAPGGSTVDLFGKQNGGDENGLGLVDDPTGDHEIQDASFIRLTMPAGLTNVSITMNSVTGPDSFDIFGSTSATTGYSILTPVGCCSDELPHSVPFMPFYIVEATNGNVLLSSLSAVPGPIAGAGLPGLILAGGGLLGWWRRRARLSALTPRMGLAA